MGVVSFSVFFAEFFENTLKLIMGVVSFSVFFAEFFENTLKLIMGVVSFKFIGRGQQFGISADRGRVLCTGCKGIIR
jgi:hypothetical protein